MRGRHLQFWYVDFRGSTWLATSTILKNFLTRQLHLAEDIMQETVEFQWSTCTKSLEDLTAAPDLPHLNGFTNELARAAHACASSTESWPFCDTRTVLAECWACARAPARSRLGLACRTFLLRRVLARWRPMYLALESRDHRSCGGVIRGCSRPRQGQLFQCWWEL